MKFEYLKNGIITLVIVIVATAGCKKEGDESQTFALSVLAAAANFTNSSGNNGNNNNNGNNPNTLQWTTVKNNSDLNGIASSQSITVAVGSNALIKTSVDGLKWTVTKPPAGMGVFSDLNGIVWSPEKSQFVAVGGSLIEGIICTSPDGINWTRRDANKFGNAFYDIAWSSTKSLFIAVGRTINNIATSPDGINWTLRSNANYFNYSSFYGITWSQSASSFFAVGSSVYRSSDGVTWTAVTMPAAATGINFRDVTASSTGIVIAGYKSSSEGIIFTSADGGATWNQTLLTTALTPFSTAAWAGSKFVVAGFGAIYTSTNGTTWTQSTFPTITADFSKLTQDVIWSSSLSKYIGVSGGSNFSPGLSGKIITSADGITWTAQSDGPGGFLQGSVWSPEKNLYIAVGDSGSILTSPNGTDWTERSSGVTGTLYAVTWSAGRSLFAATGANGVVLTSPDGASWTSRLTPNALANYYDITWSPASGVFVAVGDIGTIIYSADGITWSQATSGVTSKIKNIVWAPELSLLVASGEGGKLLRSSNGISWSVVGVGGTQVSFEGLAWSGSRFVADDQFGNFTAISTDGVNWTELSYSGLGWPFDLTWYGGKSLFVIVGTGGSIYTSTDGGTSRTLNTTGSAFFLLDVNCSDVQCIAIGSMGTILKGN